LPAIPVAGDRSLTVCSISDNSVTLRQPKPDFDFWHVELMFAKNDRFLMAFYFLRDGTEHLRVTDLQSGTASIFSNDSKDACKNNFRTTDWKSIVQIGMLFLYASKANDRCGGRRNGVSRILFFQSWIVGANPISACRGYRKTTCIFSARGYFCRSL